MKSHNGAQLCYNMYTTQKTKLAAENQNNCSVYYELVFEKIHVILSGYF